ncbi:efflux RND transporter periplasmic adaptor subunit [Clostridium sp.]|uniref:efflux RND transporter periplasmic adaptor subunit n=1 Tax=Clostridium sp. TaxID=1506 RepID=UPI00283FF30C|nr:efflux RND transporter periplasmic adaptor subunit [Clostridium sp.]MDR3598359.1 efflux RND transporter periplasmic adaptor subunit [Clostridium sp.]
MKNKKLFWSVIIVIICVTGISGYIIMQQGQAAETSIVEKGEIKHYVDDTAVVQSNNKQTVYIEGSGKITGINVNVGDSVKKNDILLTMDKKDMELKLKDADSKIDAAKAQLESADISNYANKIEVAQAEVDKAKISYESAERNFNNSKILYETGAISKQEFDNSEDAYKSAEADLRSSNNQLEDIKKGTPSYVKEGYMAGLEQAMILKDSIMSEIDKQQVLAPIDGVIIEKLVEENSMGTPGTAAFLVGDTKSLELESDILSDDIYRIKIGNDVEISGKAIGDSILNGKVVKIAPEAKNITSSLGVNQKRVPITIEISDDTDLLKPGYDLDVKVITEVKSDTLVIPDSAVFDYQGNSCVFVVENGKAVIRQINKGIESENEIEVLDGLKEGEKILSKPNNDTKEGMKIKE